MIINCWANISHQAPPLGGGVGCFDFMTPVVLIAFCQFQVQQRSMDKINLLVLNDNSH